jgi:hypothetical protein
MHPAERKKSWLVRVSLGQLETVYSGDSVELGNGFLAEGVWAGDFSARGILSAPFRCGSGIVEIDDFIVAFGPSHSLGRIYVYRSNTAMWISNSLHLIIAVAPEATPTCPITDVWSKAQSVIKGIEEYTRPLYTVADGLVSQYVFNFVAIDRRDLSLSEIRSSQCEPYFGFSHYEAHLSETLARLINCGRDIRRKHVYSRLVSTVSAGYDSAACCALAKRFDAELAVTLKSGRGGDDDSGEEIAKQLGVQVSSFDRFCLDREDKIPGSELKWLNPEHLEDTHWEFLASINSPGEVFFVSFEPYLHDALLLTGFHGDKVWDLNSSGGHALVRGDASGTGLDEFSSRVDFITIPVPFIGAWNSAEIARINSSSEMADFSIPGYYNRPIPRRIVEQAGVRRDAFGQKKVASEVLLSWSVARPVRERSFQRLIDEYKAKI